MNSNPNSRSKKFRVKEERNNNSPVQLQHSEQTYKYNQAETSGVKKEEEKFVLEPEFKLDEILHRQRKKEKKDMWNKFVSYVGSYRGLGENQEFSSNLFTPAFHYQQKYDQIARPGNFAPKGTSYARLYKRRDKAESDLERISYMMYLDPMQIFIIQPALLKLDPVNFDKDFDNYLDDHVSSQRNRRASSAESLASADVPKESSFAKYEYQITYPSIGPIFYSLLRNPPLLLEKNRHSFYHFIFPVLTLQYFVSVYNDSSHYFLNFSPTNIFLDNELLKMMDISFISRRAGPELLALIENTLTRCKVEFWMPVEISFLARALKNETLKQKLDVENPSFLDAEFFYHPQFYSSLQEFIRNGIRDGKCEKIMASLEHIDYDERLDGDLCIFLNKNLKILAEQGGDEKELVKRVARDIYNYYMVNINSKLETYAFGQMLYTFTLMFNSSLRSIEQKLRIEERPFLAQGQRVPETLRVALVKLENTQILLKVLLKYVMENMININYKKRKTLGEAFREIVFMMNYYDGNIRAEYYNFIEKNIRKMSGDNRDLFEYVRNQNNSVITLKNFLRTNLVT